MAEGNGIAVFCGPRRGGNQEAKQIMVTQPARTYHGAMHGLRGALALAACATSACSLLVDTDQVQCSSNNDCMALGFPSMECKDSLCVEPEIVETPFSCKDDPFVAQSTTETVDFSMSVFNLVARTPYEGLTIFSCPQLDTECATPLGQTDSAVDGRFTLSLPVGFRGHLFAPMPVEDPLAPRIITIFPPPGPNILSASEEFFVAPLMVIGGIAQLAGGAILPGTGHIFVTASDCNGDRLSGVSISVATVLPETFDIYIGDSGMPDQALLSTGNIGQAAIANVPPGFATVRAVHETEGKIFEQSVLVNDGTVTSVSTVIPSQN